MTLTIQLEHEEDFDFGVKFSVQIDDSQTRYSALERMLFGADSSHWLNLEKTPLCRADSSTTNQLAHSRQVLALTFA